MTVQRNQLRVYVCSSLVVLLLLLQCPVGILGNWGLEVGRANASDVATLSKDWLRFRKVRDDVVAATLFEGTLERQKQLIGVAIEGLTPQQRYEEVEKFWLDNLIGPLQKIARNPAASCAESQFALATLMGMQRQQQLLGLLEDDKVTASDRVKTELETTEKIVTVRCREEAVDECVATGRIMQILELVLGDDRQSRLRGIEPDDGR